MKKLHSHVSGIWIVVLMLVSGVFFTMLPERSKAQIWGPEGLNMPGGWNSWTNPPVNNLALASYTQVTGGRVTRIAIGSPRWQTIFSVATSGGDIVGGTYNWLFTSGPTGNPWGNKWASVTVAMNTLQTYTKEGGSDNSITVSDGKWYTMNFEDVGYSNTRAIFMETSAEPVTLASVSVPSNVQPATPAPVTITLSVAPCAEEIFYIRYTTDGWATSEAIAATVGGTSATAQIPGKNAGTVVSYYAFSSTLASITADFDLLTIRMNNNGGPNYTYTVATPVPVISFANLLSPPSGSIQPFQLFTVTGHAEIPGVTGQGSLPAGLEAWVGWNTSNTDPSGWNNWMPAAWIATSGTGDDFAANLGSMMNLPGTFHYATRFRYNAGSYVYGGYSATGGGFWDGLTNISGTLTVVPPSVPANRTLENVSVNPEETVCYDATETITLAGNETFFKVLAGGSVTLVAGQKITMLPGTGIAPGGYLLAYISTNGQYCPTSGEASPGDISLKDGIYPDHRAGISIFPNPASETVGVRVNGIEGRSPATIVLSDIRGNELQSATVNGDGIYPFAISSLMPGVYIVKLVSCQEAQTIKLIKK